MANLKDIQRKIKSVSSTQKTTRAMKLVSTAKLRKAEELAKRSKKFANKLNSVIAEISSKIKCSKDNAFESIRYLSKIENPKMVDIIFITADKGLCGGFNSQTIKAAKNLISEFHQKKAKVRLRGVGKKGIEYFKYNEIEMLDEVIGLSSKPDQNESDKFISASIEDYKNGKTDAVYIVYNGYKNMLTQELHVNKILPLDCDEFKCEEEVKGSLLEIEAYDQEKMLNDLIEVYIKSNMYFALIDSVAAEHSARMQAMDTATNNAKEMVKTLNVAYNKARQAAITTELIEIISGVESMK